MGGACWVKDTVKVMEGDKGQWVAHMLESSVFTVSKNPCRDFLKSTSYEYLKALSVED